MTTATLQRERPGLFNTPMVRAIDEDRKTNTRRMVKLPKPYRWDDEQKGMVVDDPGQGRWHIEELTHLAPYQVGDTIWVRETHVIGLLETPVEGRVFQRIEADEFRSEYGDYLVPYYFAIDEDPHLTTEDAAEGDDRTRWKPSIHMPRWAARLFLKVTSVRVERLQEISEGDAKAEGFSKELCASVFKEAWDGKDFERHCWLTNNKTVEDDPEGRDFCPQCAEKECKKLGKDWVIDGNMYMAHESDGPACCVRCGKPLLMSLTDYGVETQLLEPTAEHFVQRDTDAAIAYMLADDIGSLGDHHLGRLAQMGFATLWDSIYSNWNANPWVWVITFEKMTAV